MDRHELTGWLRLALTPRIGPRAARRLLAALGLPKRVFQADPTALRDLLSAAQVQALQVEPPGLVDQVEATWHWLSQDPGCRRVLTLADADYPPALLHADDPPLLLYAMGQTLACPGPLAWPEAIAVVGSRNPTPQGALNARQFARSFARAGWCVVSGLALGVDAAAHEGALEGAPDASEGECARPVTLAVVGTGLDRVYPSQHQDLAHRIAARGLVLGEYPLGTPPLSENFPRRNRILCALARGTLVVEAAMRSGSLITARLAAEQGREVFAIPGSIHSPQSRGCHALIKQGAKLVETAQEVLDELPALPAGSLTVPADEAAAASSAMAPAGPLGPGLPADPLLQALGHDPVTLDALAVRTGLDAATLLARLLDLELQGELARMPGGLYQRTALA
ncbi:MAG: hypothetical protein RIS88_2086 [Pseudomonadota bacterium]